MPMRYEHDHENDILYFGKTNFRNQMKTFGIKTDDRRRHIYIVGKTGMGKTTLQENMFLSDIYAGHGCCYIDPHGDTAEKVLDYIPSWRINDVVYFNPSDMDNPIGFNILESVDEEMKHLVASGMMGVFKKIWENVWSARMEYILNNTILALLDTPGSTLLGINRMLSDKDYRKQIILNIKDPIVKQFWVKEFGAYQDKFASEAVAPIQNKVGQFLSAAIIRNIVAQAKSTLDIRKIMDDQQIFICNLSKGRIGEDASRLLGGMLITKIQMAAMERVDTREEDRQDFYLYVDEFQNFAVESFASILSEARKYRLNLVMAHQYIAQLTEEVRDAVFGNVGTIIAFRVGSPDAIFMEQEFMPRFVPEDIINLAKFNIYLKLMIDGVTSLPFSAVTLPPIAMRTGSAEKVVQQSQERYGGNREQIEEHVSTWSGFGKDVDVEKEMEAMKDQKKAAKKKKYGHEYVCTRCEKTFSLPVELDRSRPIYCEECMPIIKEERKKGKKGDRGDNKRSEKKRSEKKRPPAPEESGELIEKEVTGSISLSELAKDESDQGQESLKATSEKAPAPESSDITLADLPQPQPGQPQKKQGSRRPVGERVETLEDEVDKSEGKFKDKDRPNEVGKRVDSLEDEVEEKAQPKKEKQFEPKQKNRSRNKKQTDRNQSERTSQQTQDKSKSKDNSSKRKRRRRRRPKKKKPQRSVPEFKGEAKEDKKDAKNLAPGQIVSFD